MNTQRSNVAHVPNLSHIRQWVEALESGQYAQTYGRLRKGDAYCCLGVACEVTGGSRWDDHVGGYSYGPNEDASSTMLPRFVRDWLGVEDTDPIFITDDGVRHTATYINDDLMLSFKQIAECIRRTYGLEEVK